VTALERAISPTEATAMLAKAGVPISERTLRAKARQIGACRVIGRCMFLMPEDIDRIIETSKLEPKECPTSTAGEKSGNTVSRWTEKELDNLLTRVTEGSRKTSRQNTKPASVVRLSTAKKRF